MRRGRFGSEKQVNMGRERRIMGKQEDIQHDTG